MNPGIPVYGQALVGTFANNGLIVGQPFVIGNGPAALTVPAGANQLLLGINDNFYGDNAGSFTVSVSQPYSLCLMYDPTKRHRAAAPFPSSFNCAMHPAATCLRRRSRCVPP